MAFDPALANHHVDIAEVQSARVAAQGCEADAHLAYLLSATGARSGPDLADAVHLLCAIHGHYPGLLAIAASRASDPVELEWLREANDAFEGERSLLLRLTAAVGPMPSTPGAAETESSLLAARHALETLAGSERSGCSLGAACALVADWRPIRRVLDRAASRCGIEGPVSSLPATASVTRIMGHSAANPATARALAFGSEQLLLQHRAVFALLEARADARSAC